MPIVHPVPAFEDNYLWVIHDDRDAVAVDPGDADAVAAYLRERALTLRAILVTHHHGDHAGGIGGLLDAFGASIPVYGPAGESIAGVGIRCREGDTVALPAPDVELTVLDVPGHTAGHIAYLETRRGWLFCGDTLFAAGCGRLLGGTAEQMQPSLARLRALPADTQVFCAHEYTLANLRFALAVEPDNARLVERQERESRKRAQGQPTLPSTIGIERDTNPFLRWDAPTVESAVRRAFPGKIAPNAAPHLVFAALREWKNAFR